MSEEERRKKPRYKISVPSKIETPEGFISALATDISLEGIQVMSPHSINTGTTVSITLLISEKTTVEGTVIWKKKKTVKEKTAFQMGIQIYAIVLDDLNAMGFPERLELTLEVIERIKRSGK